MNEVLLVENLIAKREMEGFKRIFVKKLQKYKTAGRGFDECFEDFYREIQFPDGYYFFMKIEAQRIINEWEEIKFESFVGRVKSKFRGLKLVK